MVNTSAAVFAMPTTGSELVRVVLPGVAVDHEVHRDTHLSRGNRVTAGRVDGPGGQARGLHDDPGDGHVVDLEVGGGEAKVRELEGARGVAQGAAE